MILALGVSQQGLVRGVDLAAGRARESQTAVVTVALQQGGRSETPAALGAEQDLGSVDFILVLLACVRESVDFQE